ncbi:energy transducer TonB [Luteibacter sp. PPL201]|jgi:hypothetical protein|uniref:Energy transducer TonB n=1 Tax=Luteibacter sahnii TaxID=3021977 RepID=A0ABT6B5Y5_9GAMM|nr:energy transducer TonB [Luteibacter sp. PPL193]MDY1548529.1 energy transducer TonB [Luteibacter sp. PPL193]
MKGRQWVWGSVALAMAGLAMAAGPGAARKRAEASMVITGDIAVAPDGHVTGYTLDKQEKIPEGIATLIGRSAPRWRFRPVERDGQAVAARAHMSLRIVAKRESPESDAYVARIAGASFGEDNGDTERLTYAERSPPAYPMNAASAGVFGTVYLVLRVGHDGKVQDAAVEQVNLGVAASDNDMKVWRKVLAMPALHAARSWTFHPPTQGVHANDPTYVARVPVSYQLSRGARPDDAYGTWQAYVPGPKEPVTWLKDDGSTADALPDDGLYLVNSGLTLTTPIENG